jgi:geranylgeranyl reductase family protein
MIMERFDVGIVGAGPAGSSAAIHLARKGYSVALLDKEQFPREKLCGDFLNPINWPVLRDFGVDRELLARSHEKVTTFHFTSFSGDEAEVPLPGSEDRTLFGLGLRRSDLDYVLLKKAESQGAIDFQECKLKELKREARGWIVRYDRRGVVEELRARVLIGADGRNSWVAHHLGLSGKPAMQRRAVGFQLRLKCSNTIYGKVEIHLFPGGYAGIVGLGGNTLNLCLAVDKSQFQHHRTLRRLLESCLSVNPHLQWILTRSEAIGEARSVYPVYFPPRRSYGYGVLLVGDAARVNEPVTGEGIYFALKSGQFAAGAVDQAFRKSDFSAEQLSSYDRESRLAFRTRWRINRLIRWLIYRPALLSPLIRFSGSRRGLLDSLVHRICLPEVAR